MPALIRAAEVCLSYPMADRDPIDAWVDGRIALVGDAAHPMYPIGANGSSQALLDAEAIAECIAARPRALPDALLDYQSRRLAAANAVVVANRERGPERLLQLADAFRAEQIVFAGDTLDDARCLSRAREAKPWLRWRFAGIGPDRERFCTTGDLQGASLRELLPLLAEEA